MIIIIVIIIISIIIIKTKIIIIFKKGGLPPFLSRSRAYTGEPLPLSFFQFTAALLRRFLAIAAPPCPARDLRIVRLLYAVLLLVRGAPAVG